MDEPNKKIMRMVEDGNKNNIPVCQKTLSESLDMPKQTVNRRVRELVGDGHLEERPHTDGRARRNHLYIPTSKKKTSDRKMDEILRKMDAIMEHFKIRK